MIDSHAGCGPNPPPLRYDSLRMPSQAIPDQTQPQILRTYTTLHQLRSDWGASLILSLGLDAAGAALSIAANIAGAVSLAIDNNPTHLREVVRTGAADFIVNTLDEAIRAMKNEIRKRAPLSIALNAEPFLTLTEIQDRGLAPQLFSTFLSPAGLTPEQACTVTKAAHQFQADGAFLIDFADQPAPGSFTSGNELLTPLLNRCKWSLQTYTFDSAATLRAFDARALAFLSPEHPEDTLRRRWLEAAPRILQRQRPPQRSLWLSSRESALLPRT
jgi:Urocanase Rossmann-like domain